MSFTVKCSKCNATCTAEDEWLGLESECPGCGATITIEKAETGHGLSIRKTPQSNNIEISSTVLPSDGQNACPNCQKPISNSNAIICIECGTNLKTGKKVLSSALSEPTLPIPNDPPRGTKPYFEVLVEGSTTERFNSIDELRDALLKGRITRHNWARRVKCKPVGNKLAVRNWESYVAWRQIGQTRKGLSPSAGFAEEHTSIKLLYKPEEVYGDYGRAIGGLLAFLFFIAALIMIWSWDLKINPQTMQGGNPSSRGVADAIIRSVFQGKTIDVPSLFCKVILTLLVAVSAFLLVLGGWTIGAALGRRRMHSFPRPPEDGFCIG